MSGSKSDFLENVLLDQVLGGQSYSPPANIDVALYTLAPDDAGGGTEVSAGGYQRVSVPNNATQWPAASDGVKSNGEVIEFPQATASWGTIVAVGLFDGNNLLYWGTFNVNKSIGSGDTVVFEAGSLQVTED